MAAAFTLSETEALNFDVERAGGSSSSVAPARWSFGLKHVAAAMIGGGALAACGAGLRSMTQTRDESVTARMLFEAPDIHDVVSDNVVNIASTMPKFHHSKEEVHHIVQSTFAKLTELLQKADPEAWQAWEKTKLSKEQRAGIVHMLSYLSDPRVMELGLEAAKAVQAVKSSDPEAMKAAVIQRLGPKTKDLEKLHGEAIEKSLQHVVDKDGEGFKSLLTPKKVALLKSFSDEWYAKLGLNKKAFTKEVDWLASSRRLQYQAAEDAAAPAAAVPGGQPYVAKPYQKAEEAVSIISTALAEADALLRIVNPLCKILPHGHDLKIPPMVTSALGAADFATQLTSCELDGAADRNPEEMFGCPMMSASAGFDMLREPCTLVGVCGDNNDKNGKQGNHAGHQVHEGILDDGAEGKEFEKDEYKYPLCLAFGTCGKHPASSTTIPPPPPSTAAATTTIPPPPPSTVAATTKATTTEATTEKATTTEAATTKAVTTEAATTEKADASWKLLAKLSNQT